LLISARLFISSVQHPLYVQPFTTAVVGDPGGEGAGLGAVAFVFGACSTVMVSVVLFDIPMKEEEGHCVAAPAATSQSGVAPLQPKPIKVST